MKGKEQAVRSFELVSKAGEASADQMAIIQSYAEALGLYRDKNFMAAKEKFAAIPNDPPSAMFADRCEEFIKNPPAADWDGVYTFTTK